MARILRFVSPPLSYRSLSSASPQSVQHRGFRLIEQFTPDTATHAGESYGTYQLIVEQDVPTSESYWGAASAGVDLVNDLDLVWAYAGALPLRAHAFGPGIRMIEPPRGWTWNGTEVHEGLKRDERQAYLANLSIITHYYRSGDGFFLGKALQALKAYEAADALTRTLVHPHFEGMTSSTEDGPHFLYSKALEIIRAILSGRTDAARQRHLPPDIQARLKHGLPWLMRMANNRLNTRHAIARGRGTTLHPQMTPREELDFLWEADTVIRTVISQRLGVEVLVAY